MRADRLPAILTYCGSLLVVMTLTAPALSAQFHSLGSTASSGETLAEQAACLPGCSSGETSCPASGRIACCPASPATCCPDLKNCCAGNTSCVCTGVCPGPECECTGCAAPPSTRACCLRNGSCAEITSEECTNRGGTITNSVSCDEGPCSGACVLGDGCCEESTAALCEAGSGTFQPGRLCGELAVPATSPLGIVFVVGVLLIVAYQGIRVLHSKRRELLRS